MAMSEANEHFLPDDQDSTSSPSNQEVFPHRLELTEPKHIDDSILGDDTGQSSMLSHTSRQIRARSATW